MFLGGAPTPFVDAARAGGGRAAHAREPYSERVPRANSAPPESDDRAEGRADRSGHAHRERAPERNPDGGPSDGRAALPCAQCPNTARETREAAATEGIATLHEARETVASGSAAPTAKVPADASAAWIGRAVVASVMPSSSRA